jgi:hypothetical protein
LKNLYQLWSQHLRRLLKYSLLVTYICTAQAKIATIYSVKDIEEKSKNNPYLVVFAYKKDFYNKKDREFKQKIDRISKTVENLAEKKEYLMTGVRFAKASADESFWADLTQKTTENNSQSICFLIFEDGNILEKNNIAACIFGEQGTANLKEFIDEYLGDEIAQTMKTMEEEKRKRAEEDAKDDNQSRASISVYYPSYYDPYYYNWGYPWYSYGPRWGYSGWSGYRHRRHYNRGWHGSGHHRGGSRHGGRHRGHR